MNNTQKAKQERREKRALRVRKTLRGNHEKPRLCVFKSNRHISVQLIDDEKGITIGSAATIDKDFQGTEFAKKSKESAKKVGEKIAEIAKKNNINEVIFDRGRFKYHGILAEVAEGARASGLKF